MGEARRAAGAKTIYEEACRGASSEDLKDLTDRINFPFPGEAPEDSISRAILDVFDRKQAWIDHHRIKRDEDLERKIEVLAEERDGLDAQCQQLRAKQDEFLRFERDREEIRTRIDGMLAKFEELEV